MQDQSAIDELKKLEDLCETRNDWYTKVETEKKKKGGKRNPTPKVQAEEGSSSQPQKKQEDETEANVEKHQEQLTPETEQLLKDIDDTLEAEKSASKIVVDDEEESSSGSEVDIDAEVERWIRENYDPKDKRNKRRERGVLMMMMKHMFHQRMFSFVNDDLVKKLQKKVNEVLSEKKKLEERVKSVESKNSSLLKKIEADQVDIDILKVRIADLEEEKSRRDEQNEYFKLKNQELEAKNAKKEHEEYMLKKVLEDLIGKPIEQRFEEIELAEVRARREAEIEAGMKDKGKDVLAEDDVQVTEREIVLTEPKSPTKVLESSIPAPCPLTSVPGVTNIEDDEEDEDDNLKDDADEVYSVHSDNDDDNGNDDADQDNANEEPENAGGEGEHGDAENVDEIVDQGAGLILRLEHDVEEGEILHIYTRAEIIKMMNVEENEFNFDFEKELNEFDINHQPAYQYKYVEEADNYDKVEVEDWSDDDQSKNVDSDTSSFPTLAELFSQANEDELRRKVAESVKSKSFREMSKEEQREERKKWFRMDTERKYKRPIQYYRRDRDVSLGYIISWGYLPQVNAYAIRREFGVQYFQYIQDIMSLPWWDVEELSQAEHYHIQSEFMIS
ncbi:glutamic acid-rich protein-like [Helianthus annuus]|uniref:glutamic acid-rich protein-like n=1 Tax=Helianthus annuus TaxID=4232 RepID=UPI000B8FFB78|nr:glutamic acid-rich protein-like [Helianthus annuus]